MVAVFYNDADRIEIGASAGIGAVRPWAATCARITRVARPGRADRDRERQFLVRPQFGRGLKPQFLAGTDERRRPAESGDSTGASSAGSSTREHHLPLDLLAGVDHGDKNLCGLTHAGRIGSRCERDLQIGAAAAGALPSPAPSGNCGRISRQASAPRISRPPDFTVT